MYVIITVMYIHRQLEDTLEKYLKIFPAVTITGPRQSGKSTMLKEFLKEVCRILLHHVFEQFRIFSICLRIRLIMPTIPADTLYPIVIVLTHWGLANRTRIHFSMRPCLSHMTNSSTTLFVLSKPSSSLSSLSSISVP